MKYDFLGSPYKSFFRLRKFPSISGLLRVCIMNGCRIFSNALFMSFKIILEFLYFFFQYFELHLLFLNQICIPGRNPLGHDV